VTEIVNIKTLENARLALQAYCVEFYALHVFVPWKSRLAFAGKFFPPAVAHGAMPWPPVHPALAYHSIL
jgi:hypothetical protein